MRAAEVLRPNPRRQRQVVQKEVEGPALKVDRQNLAAKRKPATNDADQGVYDTLNSSTSSWGCCV